VEKCITFEANIQAPCVMSDFFTDIAQLSFKTRLEELKDYAFASYNIQNEQMFNLLNEAQACFYGRKYNFRSIFSYQDFRERLPILQNSDIQPYLRKMTAVTVDESGVVNFPYLYASSYPSSIIKTRKRLSFCCSILSNSLLSAYDFKFLDPDKSWFDVFISHKSRKLGFNNYLITKLPILHRPHSSRPWKQLKYSRPWKYYFLKILKQRDKI
jgi:hypothetical protein